MAVLTSIQVNAVGYMLNKHKQLGKYWMCFGIKIHGILRLIMFIKYQKKKHDNEHSPSNFCNFNR